MKRPTLKLAPRLRVPSLAGAFLALAIVGGCQTERVSTGVVRPAPAQPHEAPALPEGARVNRMVFVVGSKPLDTDGNGYPDRIEASVTLFSAPHPTPLWAEGRIVCSMYLKGEASDDEMHEPVTEWIYEGGQLEQARFRSQIGRQYHLTLSLHQTGTDRLPFGEVDLVCRFEPADGRPAVRSEGVRSIQIGRRISK